MPHWPDIAPDTVLDCRGLRCPMPLLRLKQVAHRAAPGHVLLVEATDPGSLRDFQAYCRSASHELLAMEERGLAEAPVYAYLVRVHDPGTQGG